MKRRISILIVVLVLFSIPAWAIYQSSTFGNRNGVAAGGGPLFSSDDAVYVICSDEYWTTNSSTYTGQNVDGNYTSLSAWQTARAGTDTASQNSIAIINGTYSLTATYQHTGWTDKNAGYYFIIQYDPVLGSRHDGTRDGSGDTISVSVNDGYCLRFDEARCWVKDIKIIDSGGSSSSAVIAFTLAPFYFSNNFLYEGRAITEAIYMLASSGGAYVWNNNFTSDALVQYFIRNEDATLPAYIYHNSIYSTAGRGVLGNAYTVMRNNANFAYSVQYAGSMDIDYEATSASSGAGANSTHSLAASDVFLDTTMASADLHLDSGGASYSYLNDQGADLRADGNLPVTDDIDGNARSATPNIGSDE